MSITELLNDAPKKSLLAGFETTRNRENESWNYAVLRGTPDGFRMLAAALHHMADVVDMNGEGWHLAASPENVPTLMMANVKNLALDCRPDNSGDVEMYDGDLGAAE